MKQGPYFFTSRILFVSLLLQPLAIYADSADGSLQTQVKTQEPPCQFVPSMDFMSEHARAFDRVNMTSAAWFARTVQLTDDLRNQAWQSLAVKPQRVLDFVAKPFGLHSTLLEFDDQVLVLYRGTEDVLDYVLNGTFFTTKGDKHGLPGWVHEGFLINFYLSWARVRNALKEATEAGKSIVFASHSLGGVLSQYAAWLAESEGMKVIRVYAFQAPNPGDSQFKSAFDERFAGRASNTLYGDDVTPHIPPIFESAEAFGKASLKPLASTLVKLLDKANYGALAGRFGLDAQGNQSPISESRLPSSEIEYWTAYQKKMGGQPFPLGMNSQTPVIADHDIDRVLCALVKNALTR